MDRSTKLEFLPTTADHFYHVVLWHETLPSDSAPKDVWLSLNRLEERFAKLESEVSSRVVGGLAMREVDRSRTGVTVHMHVLYGTSGAIKQDVLKRAWKNTALKDEFGEEQTGCRIHRTPLRDFLPVLLYVAGTRRIGGVRVSKLLDGMVYGSPSQLTLWERERLQRWNAKGPTSADQLRLILAGLAYRLQQPGWRGAWDFRTRAGKRLKRRLQVSASGGKGLRTRKRRRRSNVAVLS